jgi:hypothetical protein
MTRNSLLLAAFISTAAALPAAAASDPSPVRAEVMFWLIDRNGDKVIDATEIEALRSVVFDAIDLNHDGRLTKDEAKSIGEAARVKVADHLAAMIKEGPAKIAERRARLGAALGLDDPKGIARDEFVNRPSRLLGNADKDNSGGITSAEFEAASGNLRQLILPE